MSLNDDRKAIEMAFSNSTRIALIASQIVMVPMTIRPHYGMPTPYWLYAIGAILEIVLFGLLFLVLRRMWKRST